MKVINLTSDHSTAMAIMRGFEHGLNEAKYPAQRTAFEMAIVALQKEFPEVFECRWIIEGQQGVHSVYGMSIKTRELYSEWTDLLQSAKDSDNKELKTTCRAAQAKELQYRTSVVTEVKRG